jgi:histidine kinase
MLKSLFKIDRLALKLMLSVGIVLFASIFVWSYFTIHYQEKSLISKKISEVDKFCNTALHFTWFAMLHHTDKDLHEVLKNMSDYNEIESIKIFNWQGQVKFSNNPKEIDTMGKKTDDACISCHSKKNPILNADIKDRVRIFKSDEGELLLGIINPIMNEPSCSTAQCHYHPKKIKKLGSLDIVVSLKGIKTEIALSKKLSAWTAIYLFIILGITICFSILRLVTQPIKKLISETDLIGKGDYKDYINEIHQKDEIGQLSIAINDMGK